MENRYALLFFLVTAFIIQGCATDNGSLISGQVVESSSSNPLQGAIVQVTSPENFSNKSTVTDSSGNFSLDISVSEPQTISLKVTKADYIPTTKEITITSDNDEKGLSIKLKEEGSDDGGGGDDDKEDDEVGGDSGPPHTLELKGISSSSIAIRGSGGDETSKFTFVVTDTAGRPVEQGYKINFDIVKGPNGGELINPRTDITSPEGIVSAAIASGDKAGAVKIKASAPNYNNVFSTPVLVAIGNGFTIEDNFNIASVYRNFEAWGLIAAGKEDDKTTYSVQSNYVVVSLGDRNNNPVLPGTAVDFTTTAGIITANAVTDKNGIAVAELRPDGSKPTGNPRGIGFGTVTARTVDINDDYITLDTDVLFSSSKTVSIKLYDPGTTNDATVNITTDEGSQELDVVIKDINGYPIGAGSKIEIITNGGISSSVTTFSQGDHTTTGSGKTRFNFSISEEKDDDSDPPSNTSVQVKITFPSGITALGPN